jgi:hypothetical protein
MDDQLKDLLQELCKALSDLWALESFKGSYWRNDKRQRAETILEDEASLTPLAKNPIRGYSGVKLQVSEDPSKTLIKIVESLILDSQGRPESFHPPALQDALKKVRTTVDKICSAIDSDFKLSYRLFGSAGYKTFSPEQFLEMQQRENWKPSIHYYFSIAELFASELVANGFKVSERTKFNQWDKVLENSLCELQKLRLEENFYYEVCIFLNGPLVDKSMDILIAQLSLDKKPIEISLGHATDEILTSLVEHEKHPAIEKINTVIKYKVDIPIEAGEEDYLVQYHNASLVAQLLLDSLRLCRPLDDIGVLAIEVLPRSFSAPIIRKTWASQFQSELARFEPKRFDFSSASLVPLGEQEIERIKRTLLSMLPLGGLKHNLRYAVRRFRNSIENYSIDDSERLLEYAIALEALYLNEDG